MYERKLYTVPRECLHKVSLTNISYAAEPQELLQAYQNFTKHFDGCYVRDREYYVLLQTKLWLHRSRWWYIGTGRGRFAAI